MLKISRVDLADFDSPERIVQEIDRLIPDIPIPVPVDELALTLDIISIEALETEGFEGGLLTDADKSEGIILVNKDSTLQRRRFTISHELGHFLCFWHKPPSVTGFFVPLMICGWYLPMNRTSLLAWKLKQTDLPPSF